jgi:hypothetical protein
MYTNAFRLHIVILGIFMSLSNFSFGQSPMQLKEKRIKDSLEFYKSLRDSNVFIDHTLFNKKLDSVLNKVSGVTYKEGKGIRSSATVDEKGLNLNFLLADGPQNTFQLALSGRAEEKFVDIISKGKYGNTLGAGIVWNYFPALNSAKFQESDKVGLYNKIDNTSNYFNLKIQKEVGLAEVRTMILLFRDYGKYLKDETQIAPKDIVSYDDSLSRLKVLLKKYKSFLPEDFAELDLTAQIREMTKFDDDHKLVFSNFLLKQNLDSVRNIQLNAPFVSFFYLWTTVSMKFNSTKYSLFDDTAKTTDYTRKSFDNFATLDLSLNFLKKWKNSSLWFLPTAKLAYKRKFDEDKLVSMSISKEPVLIAGETLETYKEASFYKEDVKQKFTMTTELPFVLYFSKRKFGLELAATHELYPWKNFGGRIGVYIPFNTGTEQIIIEPLIKFENLERSEMAFKKNKVSYGVSLTATIPKFF